MLRWLDRLLDGRTKAEEQLELEKARKDSELEKEIMGALRDIIIFPGSKSEFEDFVGYETLWVNLGGRNKGLICGYTHSEARNPFEDWYPIQFQKRITDSGVVALVSSSFNYNSGRKYYFGMPVKKAE